MDFKGKLAFITGGSTGIGRAIALELARRGTNIVIAARNEDNLRAAQKDIAAAGDGSVRVTALQLDVSDPKQVKSKVDAVIKEQGVPDFAINVAGFAFPQHFDRIPYDKFRSMLDVNLGGVWNVLQSVVPGMKARGSGNIVTVSSIAGFMGVFGYSAYGASKFGVCGLSEVLRSELLPYGIGVQVLCPPDTETPGFIEENKTKPHETRVVSGNAKVLSAEQVARAFMKSFGSKKLYVIPGNGGFIHFMNRVFPALVRSIMDGDVRKARKQIAAGAAKA